MDKKFIKERTKLESTASASWLKLKSNFKKASTQSESLHKTSENHASPDVRVDDDTSGVEMIKHPLQRGSGSVSTIIQKYETAQRGAQRGAQPQVAPVKVKPVQSTARLGVSNAFNTQLNQTLQAPPTMHDDEVSLMGSTRSIVSELSPELQMDLKRLTAGSRSVEGSTEPFVLRPKPRWRATPAATPSPPATPTPRRYPPPSPSLRRCTPPPLPLPPVIINARPKFSMPPTPPPLPKAPVDTVKRKIESTPPPRRMPANGIPTPFIAQKTRAARLAQRVESSPTDESDSSSESESDEAPRGRSPPAPHHSNAAKAAMFKQNVPMPCGEQLAAIRRKANEIQSRFSQHFPFET